MKYFLKTLIKFALSMLFVFFVLAAGYFYFDPFKIIHPRNNYSYLNVTTNRDFISTEMFIKNYPRYKYNSFIFGSSRTLAYNPYHWKKFLSEDDSPFLFDASGESMYGIYKKIKFLDSLNVKIKNALIIVCRDASFSPKKVQDGHLFIKDRRTTGQSKLQFNMAFIKAYFDPQFLLSYYTYTFTGKYQNWMKGYIDNRKITVDSVTNQIAILDQEEEITKNPDLYYEKRKDIFYTRYGQTTDTIARINNDYLGMIKEIAAILKRQNTEYKVVISPLYEEMTFNPKDLQYLKEIFGANLYDFSGENQFTMNKTNYYEKSHYRPFVGDSIMKRIYSENQIESPQKK